MHDIREKLKEQPSDTAVALALRACLRIVPVLTYNSEWIGTVPDAGSLPEDPFVFALNALECIWKYSRCPDQEKAHFRQICASLVQSARSHAEKAYSDAYRSDPDQELVLADKADVLAAVAACLTAIEDPSEQAFPDLVYESIHAAADATRALNLEYPGTDRDFQRAEDLWHAVSWDLACLDAGGSQSSLIGRSLWPDDGAPVWHTALSKKLAAHFPAGSRGHALALWRNAVARGA